MRIIVKKQQNMLPGCHSGPGLVCEDRAKLGSDTVK
jgi:hypothetical protein